MELNEIKGLLETLEQNAVSFDPHFYKRTAERPINEGMVRKFLSQIELLDKIEHGKSSTRFKLWFKMSRNYSLILIIEISPSKHLKVISAWNASRKWQNKLKR